MCFSSSPVQKVGREAKFLRLLARIGLDKIRGHVQLPAQIIVSPTKPPLL